MIKPKDYDQVSAYEEFTPIKEGGYICRIVKVEETESKAGHPMIKVALDVAEGEFKDYYKEQYVKFNSEKWGCVLYILTTTKDGATSSFKGKLIGVLFGREEYENKYGERKWNVKPRITKDVDKIRSGDFKVPDERPLNSTKEQYQNIPEGFTEIGEDEIPF